MDAVDSKFLESKDFAHKERANAALLHVVTAEGVEASDFHLFKDAYFGRDSLIVGLDTVETYPSVADVVIRSMIKHQGVKYDPMTEEEPGKIHHEARYRRHGGLEQRAIYDGLVQKLNIGHDGTYNYYGSVDATPQYIRLIDTYRKLHGDRILQRYERQGDRHVSVESSVYAAAQWLSDHIARSELGLLEFQRTNPEGITWQVLRDGAVSYIHEDGRLANPNLPVASIETQGLAYDALYMASEMVGGDLEREYWREQAERLRRATLKQFWCEEKQYWAMALDRDVDGTVRQVSTETSLPAELLDTGIFENLPDGMDERIFIDPIVRKVFSEDFITPVGIRMRSLKHKSLIPYSDYQGSEAVWPVSNNIIAKGLRRYGFHSLARTLEYASLAGTQAVGGYPEFIMVKEDGHVCWPLIETKNPLLPTLIATNVPELTQAWTISACIRMLHTDDDGHDQAGWQQELTEEIGVSISSLDMPVITEPHYIDKETARYFETRVPYAS